MLEIILIVSTVAGGIAAAVTFVEQLAGVRAKVSSPFTSQRNLLATRKRETPGSYEKRLTRFVLADQERAGHHKGQSGRSTVRVGDAAYYARNERLDVKPRLWQTGVVVDVLSALRPTRKILQTLGDANAGVNLLFIEGWVHVGMGARRNISPAGRESQHSIVSYRHTLRAASICYSIDPTGTRVRRVIEWVIDRGYEAQQVDGGWIQCKTELREVDLWGSAYALKFLAMVASSPPSWLGRAALSEVEDRAKDTIAWLEDRWHTDRWQYGAARPQDNAPLILAEIAGALRVTQSGLLHEVSKWLASRLTANGHPGPNLLDEASLAGPIGTTIRLAYALHRSDPAEFLDQTASLVSFARAQPSGHIDSAEAAMLVAISASR